MPGVIPENRARQKRFVSRTHDFLSKLLAKKERKEGKGRKRKKERKIFVAP